MMAVTRTNTAIFTGSRPVLSTIVIDNIATNIHLPDSGGISSVVAMRLIINNTDPEGFSLNISSAGLGRMKAYRSGVLVSGSEAGKSLPYTISMSGFAGVWGRTLPTLSNVSLTSSTTILCSASVVQSALNAQCNLTISASAAAVTALLSDTTVTFEDTLVVTMSDL